MRNISRNKLLLGLVALTLLVSAAPAAAQQQTEEAALRVEVQAADGTTLVGFLYHAELNVQARGLLLLHMNGGSHTQWEPLIPALPAYRVLSVDLRGFGESHAAVDWQAAIGDVQTWLDWMRSQPSIDPDRIAVVGASIGANLALLGCANDPKCVTAVAISPGLLYMGLPTSGAITSAVVSGLSQRSVLLVASVQDLPSGSDVKTLVGQARGEVGLQLYAGYTHGTSLLSTKADTVIPLIVNWLDSHLR